MIRLCKFLCLAVVGGTFALGLSACGVKGPLEPPRAAAPDPVVQADPGASPPIVESGYVAPGSVGQATGPQRTSAAVANAPAAKQRSILDWLIN